MVARDGGREEWEGGHTKREGETFESDGYVHCLVVVMVSVA